MAQILKDIGPSLKVLENMFFRPYLASEVPALMQLGKQNGGRWRVCDSVLRGAEVGLRAAVVVLRRGVEVTVVVVVVVLVVVALRGGVVVVVVVVVALDVSVGEEQRRGGRRRWRRLLGRDRQRAVALDGAVPAGHPRLRGGGEEAGRGRRC